MVAACEAAGDTVVAAPSSSVVDLREPDAVRALIADARPDVVFHLAARAHVGESWEDPLGTLADNVAMTANVLEAVRHEAPEATVISVGSGEEYGPPETVPTTEDAPLRPQNPYAVSKASSGLAARFYADAYGLRVIHARAFNHAGPGQEPIYAIPAFARQVAAGLEAGDDPVRVVSGSPDTRRDFTDVRDIVRAYRVLAEHGDAGHLQRLLRRLPLGPRTDHRPRRGRRRRDRPRDRPGQGPRPRSRGDPRLLRPPHRRHRLDPSDPAHPDPRRHPRLLARRSEPKGAWPL